MRNILLITLLLFIISCNNDDFEPETHRGKGVVEVNSRTLEFFAWQTDEESNGRISGYFYTYNNSGARIGHLSLFNLNSQPGFYPFINDTSLLFTKTGYYTIHDDHAEEFYQFIDVDTSSWYEVEEHDTSSRVLKFRMEAVYQIPPLDEKIFENSPDTIFLTNGVFEIKY